MYIGNLVKADNPDLLLTLLPNEEGKGTVLDVHNPTPHKIVADVSVLAPSFLAKRSNGKSRLLHFRLSESTWNGKLQCTNGRLSC